MDVVKAVQGYINKIVTATPGIKVLLLDPETTPIVSLASTQSTLLSHEVYLTDRIDNPSRVLPSQAQASSSAYPPSRGGVERLPHLKCICILRPSEASIEAAERELTEGRYGGYWLYFTNVLTKAQIERLAEADEHELVREVQEFYADYAPLTSSHFTLSLLPTPLHPQPGQVTVPLYGDSPSTFTTSPFTFNRHLEGLTAVLLSLKKKPVIRYERMSGMAKRLAGEVLYSMNSNPDLWDFRPSANPPLLLVLDRRNDPVTPLLAQWTYQAMVHELIGITNGRVDLSSAPEVKEDLKEIVLSSDQDPFFAANLYDNFGDLGAHLSAYVSDYSSRSATAQAKKIETVSDMKRFVEEYPEFRKLGGNVSKHVALVGELSRLVNERKLLEVSELEQSLASNESHGQDLRTLHGMITSPDVLPEAKLRLAILYALRYQKFGQNNIVGVINLLNEQDVPNHDLVHVMLNFAGADQRQDDLFANENFFSRGKSALKGLKGVENVYTQHKPHLAETIELLLRGRLKETSYPFVEGQSVSSAAAGIPTSVRPQDIIIFIVGGTTYEESRYVANLNAQFANQGGPGNQSQFRDGNGSVIGTGSRILLGGTCVHNSQSFINMVRDASVGFPASASSALSLRPTSNPNSNSHQSGFDRNPGPINLNIGPVSLNVSGQAGNALEEGVDAVRGGLQNLFGRVRQGVDGIRLP